MEGSGSAAASFVAQLTDGDTLSQAAFLGPSNPRSEQFGQARCSRCAGSVFCRVPGFGFLAAGSCGHRVGDAEKASTHSTQVCRITARAAGDCQLRRHMQIPRFEGKTAVDKKEQ